MEKIKNLFILTKFVKVKIFDTEYFARRYFKSNGYDIYHSRKALKDIKFKRNFLMKYSYAINDKKIKEIKKSLEIKKGMPDFFLVKNDSIFFVEVKSSNDGLKIDQLIWMQKNPDFKKIIFCVKEI